MKRVCFVLSARTDEVTGYRLQVTGYRLWGKSDEKWTDFYQWISINCEGLEILSVTFATAKKFQICRFRQPRFSHFLFPVPYSLPHHEA